MRSGSLALWFVCLAGWAPAVHAVEPDQVAREVVRALAEGKYEAAAARFDDKLRQTAPPAALKQTIEPLRSSHGAVRDVVVESRSSGTNEVGVELKVTWTRGESYFRVGVRKDGNVSSLGVAPEAALPPPGSVSPPGPVPKLPRLAPQKVDLPAWTPIKGPKYAKLTIVEFGDFE